MNDPAVARKNIRFVGHSDQGGRPDGTQVMLHKGHAFIGHMFSDGFSVIDVRDPRAPKPVAFIANPPNTRSHHIQVHDGILLAVQGANVWALAKYNDDKKYFTASLTESFKAEAEFAAGLRVYDVSRPEAPREIAFLDVPGLGLHRIWWVGGRYAYASAHEKGFRDHIMIAHSFRGAVFGPAQALHGAGDGARAAYLEHLVDVSHVDAQFHGGSGAQKAQLAAAERLLYRQTLLLG